MEYYKLESQEPDAPVQTNVQAFTKFTSFTWFLHRQKARIVALLIWGIILYVLFLVARSFINGECKNKPSHTISYSILLVGLIAFYSKIIHKHVSLPFRRLTYKDNFNGIGSVYHQMNNLHLEARERYNSEEAKQNEYTENAKRAFAPGLSEEERRQYYKEILKPIPSEDIKQEYDERTNQDTSDASPALLTDKEPSRDYLGRSQVLRRRIKEEYDYI